MTSEEAAAPVSDAGGSLTPMDTARQLQRVTAQLAAIATQLVQIQAAASAGAERTLATTGGVTTSRQARASTAPGTPAGAAEAAAAAHTGLVTAAATPSGVRRRRKKKGQGASGGYVGKGKGKGSGAEEVKSQPRGREQPGRGSDAEDDAADGGSGGDDGGPDGDARSGRSGDVSGSEVLRPSLYPHAPRHQLDSLESNKFEEIELLEALKLRTFEGFYNLSFIVLLFALTYISVRNVAQHGFFFRFRTTHFGCPEVIRDFRWLVSWFAISFLAAVCLFLVQKTFSVKHSIKPAGLWGAYGAIQVILLGSTTLFIYVTPISPAVSAVLLMWIVVLMMKLHSYVATNFSMHREWEKSSRKGKSRRGYPHNVTFGRLAYFLAAPTLVYESHYARSERIRKRYVLKKSLQGIGCAALQYVLMAQFILPVLRAEPSRTSGSFVLDLMKLAVPSFVMWLAGFYMLFHCLLNVSAELLRFSDRKFFDDWWNATSLDAFWRKWNIPVHEWCLRHVFIESQHYYRASKSVASFATFLMSAILHELLFSVAFKTFKAWFFLGMLGQLPMIVISRYFRGKRRGNFLVWLSLFASQPLLEILYFRAWYETHDNFFCVAA